MAHQETVHIVHGAKNAVLFLHGICGTPDHFRKLLPLEEQVPQNWSVYNVLMDGHGKQVEDFSRSSMQQWKEQVFRIFDDLCSNHEKVIIVGHSMGTLFALQMACRCPQKVPFTLLIASPMRVFVRFRGAVNLLRFPFSKWNRMIRCSARSARPAALHPRRRFGSILAGARGCLNFCGKSSIPEKSFLNSPYPRLHASLCGMKWYPTAQKRS